MSFELEITGSARLDVQEVIEWYEFNQKALGKKFVSELRTVLAYVFENPKYFQKSYNQYREAVL